MKPLSLVGLAHPSDFDRGAASINAGNSWQVRIRFQVEDTFFTYECGGEIVESHAPPTNGPRGTF